MYENTIFQSQKQSGAAKGKSQGLAS